MAITKKRTREFKDGQCRHCGLADKAKMRQGRPNYCGYTNTTGKQPDIRNGHCMEMKPTRSKKHGAKEPI